uniref:Uncharacterized protein n=1 Tax=viral metagenome TaxID=1070528 RepID=A0A6C0LGR0_9ZZZZ
MKVCNVGKGSKLLVVVFLVLLIVLCSFGLMDSGKYSCDNGLFIDHNDLKSLITDSKTKTQNFQNLSSCISKLGNSKSPLKGVSNCFNKYGYGECVEGHTSEIILIIIISLTGIFLLFNLFCMFQKNGPMAMM